MREKLSNFLIFSTKILSFSCIGKIICFSFSYTNHSFSSYILSMTSSTSKTVHSRSQSNCNFSFHTARGSLRYFSLSIHTHIRLSMSLSFIQFRILFSRQKTVRASKCGNNISHHIIFFLS